eukprot:SAG22_NODE_11337_length_490_cov_0.590793_1_plen_126_part_10
MPEPRVPALRIDMRPRTGGGGQQPGRQDQQQEQQQDQQQEQRHVFQDEAVLRIFGSIHSREDAVWAFRRMDRDGSGSLDDRELQKALVRLNIKMDLPRGRGVLQALDTNGDGRIEVDGFIQVWPPA